MGRSSKGSRRPVIYFSLAFIACVLAWLWSFLQTSPAIAATHTSARASGLPAVSPSPTCEAAWRIVPSPNEGSDNNYLTAISAVSATDIWAIGYYTSTGRFSTLTEHWDGTQWSIIPSPNPGYNNNWLQGVVAISHNDVWAVGSYDNHPYYNARHLLTLHWDGTQWNVVPNPDPGGNYTNYLNGVDALSANDVWAVGFWRRYSPQGLIMKWNGTEWVQSPNPASGSVDSMNAVTAISSNNVWAVGHTSPSNSLIWHWDGAQWGVVPSPNVGVLSAVDASGPNDIWAGGSNGILLHWDGAQWSVVSAPNVGTLNGITVLSANDAWAVGNSGILHWDGAQWSVVSGPGVGVLKAVTAISTEDVWAVGTYSIGNIARTLIAHYSPSCATASVTPMPSASSTSPATTTPVATATSVATSTSLSTATITALSSITPAQATPTSAGGNTVVVPTATPTNTLTASTTPAQATPTSGGNNTVVVPTATPRACTLAFSDVNQSSTFHANVRCLACKGIISGYADGTFRPDNLVTRGQLAKIVSNAANFTEDPNPQIYADVTDANVFYEWINRLSRRGYMGGYACGGVGEPCVNGNRPYFRPFASATRAQTSKIVSNAAQYSQTLTEQTFEDVQLSHPFYEWIQRLASRGIMSGYNCGGPGEPCTSGRPYFRPYNNVTRGQSAKIVANTFFSQCNPAHR